MRAKFLLRSLHSAAAATPFFIFFLFCVATICLGFCFCFWFLKKRKFLLPAQDLHKRKKNSCLHPTLTWRASRFHTAKYLWVLFIYHLLNFWIFARQWRGRRAASRIRFFFFFFFFFLAFGFWSFVCVLFFCCFLQAACLRLWTCCAMTRSSRAFELLLACVFLWNFWFLFSPF